MRKFLLLAFACSCNKSPSIISRAAAGPLDDYVRKSKTFEAKMNLRKIFDGLMMYYDDGKKVPASASFAPVKDCCAQGGKCQPSERDWAAPTWQALQFSLPDPHYFQYSFHTAGKGKNVKYSIVAVADPSCDGHKSYFEMHGALDSSGMFTQSAIVESTTPPRALK